MKSMLTLVLLAGSALAQAQWSTLNDPVGSTATISFGGSSDYKWGPMLTMGSSEFTVYDSKMGLVMTCSGDSTADWTNVSLCLVDPRYTLDEAMRVILKSLKFQGEQYAVEVQRNRDGWEKAFKLAQRASTLADQYRIKYQACTDAVVDLSREVYAINPRYLSHETTNGDDINFQWSSAPVHKGDQSK